jgi:hypothetical protein
MQVVLTVEKVLIYVAFLARVEQIPIHQVFAGD